MVWDRPRRANERPCGPVRPLLEQKKKKKKNTKFVEISATRFFISSNDEILNILEPTLIEVIGNKNRTMLLNPYSIGR